MKRALLTLICTVAAFVATAQNGTAENKPLNIKFQGYFNLGLIYCPEVIGLGPIVDASVGAAITDYFYAGVETGFHSLFNKVYFANRQYYRFDGYIPIALNMRSYFTKTKARPFVNVSLGGFVGVANLKGYGGFYFQTGAGVDIQNLSIGLGYSGLVVRETASSLYVKLGVRFGGKKY